MENTHIKQKKSRKYGNTTKGKRVQRISKYYNRFGTQFVPNSSPDVVATTHEKLF